MTAVRRPLGWTQRSVWIDHHCLRREDRHECTMVAAVPVDGATPAQVRRGVELVTARHESLRTTYGWGRDGVPRQDVHAAYEPAYETRELPGRDGFAAYAAELKGTVFDLGTPPVRFGLATVGSDPYGLVVAVHHIGADAWCLATLAEELRRACGPDAAERRGREETDPEDDRSRRAPARRPAPGDWEAGTEAAAAAAAAATYWDGELARTPADLFSRCRRAGPDGVRARRCVLRSAAAGRALDELGLRYGVWPSVVADAAFVLALARHCGYETVPYKLLAANRQFPPLAGRVYCSFLPVVAHVDVDDGVTFPELVRRARTSMLDALAHAYSPYDRAAEALVRHGAARGVRIRHGTIFNFQPLRGRPGAEPDAGSTLSWPDPEWQHLEEDLHLVVSHARGLLVAALNVRSDVMDAADMERFVRRFEEILLTQADDGADGGADDGADDGTAGHLRSRLGSRPAPPAGSGATGERWCLVDRCWVDLARIEACLREYPGVSAARVRAAGPDTLEALVTADPGAVTADRLRAHVMGALDRRPATMCPHRFTVTAAEGPPPPEPSGADAGDPAARRALYECVRTVNGLAEIDPDDDYVGAGGSLLRLPAVLRELETAGVTGFRAYDLTTPRPLRYVAAGAVRAGEDPAEGAP